MTASAEVTVEHGGRALLGARSRIALLVVWGVAISVVGCWHWNASLEGKPLTLMQSRADGIVAATRTLDAGGPPLLSTSGPYTPGTAAPNQRLEPVPVGDDPGAYLYLPLLGHWLGTVDPGVMLRWFFIGCMGLLLLAYPLIFYAIFDSTAAGLAAPLLLLWRFSFLENSDIYWIGAWVALLGIPGLIALYRRAWTRRSVALTAFVLVIASFASSVRAEAGLGVAIAGLGLALVREQGWRRRCIVGVVLVLAYLSIRPIAFLGVTTYRDHEVAAYIRANPEFDAKSGAHPFWHPAYLGLGYEKNPWNIHYNDADALAAAHAESPNVDETTLFLSPRYGQILRHLYLSRWKQDPGLVLREYGDKLAVTWDDVRRYFRYSLLLLIPMLAVGARSRERRRWMFLLVPTLLLALIPPVMTITYFVYELPLIATVGVLWLLIAGWLLSVLESAAHPRVRHHPEPSHELSAHELFEAIPARDVLPALWPRAVSWLPVIRRPRVQVRQLGGAAAFLAALIACSVAAAAIAPAARERSAYWQTSASLTKLSTIQGRPLATWAATVQGLDGWSGDVESTATTSGPAVTTPATPWSYDLTSPRLELPPGHYTFALSGRIADGGLGVGALATSSGTWLTAPNNYSDIQKPDPSDAMTTSFTLQAPETGVEVVLFNWALYAHPSVWHLGHAVLYREPLQHYEASYYATHGALSASSTPPSGSRLSTWSFGSGLPSRWTGLGAATRPRSRQLDVTTTSSAVAVQFESSPIELTPGRYAVVVDGEILRGGMSVGPIDTSTGTWLAASSFTVPRNHGSRFMPGTFVVAHPLSVAIAVANWAPEDISSLWSIRSVELVRLD